MTTTPTTPTESWGELKGKLQAKFQQLLDSDLLYLEGKKDEMMNKLQIKLGKTKHELAAIIENL